MDNKNYIYVSPNEIKPIINKKITLTRQQHIVGSGVLEIDNNKNIGFISKVKIFKKYRGYGYCSKLIHKIITTSIKMKLIKLYLHVRCDNSIAIKCYKDNSFKITKKNYENHQLFGYTMTLKLT